MRKPTVENIAFIVIAALAAYAGVKYLLPAAFPFLISGAVAVLSEKTVSGLGIKKGKALVSSFFALAFYILICVLLAFVGKQFYFQLSGLCSEIVGNAGRITSLAEKFLALPDFISGIGFPDAAGKITGAIAGALEGAATELLSKLPALIGKIAAAVPKILFFAFVTVTGTFYFCSSGDKLRGKLMTYPALRKLRSGAVVILKKTAAAYFLIFLLMFAVMFFGFSVIGAKYALAVASLTALADILPVLGTGIVLVPWSLVCFMSGSSARAVFLLVIWAVSVIAHRIAEPRLLGEGLGIPPIVSLISMYAGYILLGGAGMILAPVAAAIGYALIKVKNEEAA